MQIVRLETPPLKN